MEKKFKNGFKQLLEKAPALKGKFSVATAIVIYVVIVGFSWKYLKSLAQEVVSI